ncbi:unnamed protein product, partial [Mesorhabditis spiculigera]
MPITEEQLRTRLQALEPDHLEVEDESDGCGAKFRMVVVSDKFIGKTTLASHRLVQDAIKEEMPSIHAVTIKTYTRQKWAAEQQQ